MTYEDSILRAIEEVSEIHPEWAVAYMAVLMRAAQLRQEDGA
jgi:hypothetical protein